MNKLITFLQQHTRNFPQEETACKRTIDWIEKYGEFAFVKENLEGHITASVWITNPEKTKVLMMFHKRFQMWTQFGGHCDGNVDALSVAIREFHEESGITLEPKILGDIFSVQVWDIRERTSSSGMFQPAHQHYDILYLAGVPENVQFFRQEDEVDDIRWFPIEGIEKYIAEERMLYMIDRIKSLGK